MTTPRNERVTMRMLAEKLGVTKTTVSLALRGHASISKYTRDRVAKLALEMNYRPDPAIAAIAAQRWGCSSLEEHRIIAVLSPKRPMAKTVAAMLEVVKERGESLGYKLLTVAVEDYADGKALTEALTSQSVRGIVVPPMHASSAHQLKDIDWSKFTAVCCGLGRVRPPVHAVTSDLFLTTRMVWEVVAAAGYKRVGAVVSCHSPVAEEDWQRLAASTAAMHFLSPASGDEIPVLTVPVEKTEPLIRWYRTYRPKVIIAFNHKIGEDLEAHGINIPGDVEVVCLTAPRGSKWSGIAHHLDEVARSAVDLLNTEICKNHWGIPQLPSITLLKPEWNCGLTFCHDEQGKAYIKASATRILSPTAVER